MFSIGQTIVLGLAGSVYVVGAALLLGGRSILEGDGSASSDGEGGWVVRAGTAERPPAYFVPDLDERPVDRLTPSRTADSTGGRPLIVEGRPTQVSHSKGTGDATGRIATPLCLN